MNVVEEKIDDLNAVLRISVTPEDYAEKVDGIIKQYRKEANIPGFRPGKTPLSLIQKKYGKSILADELNKLINDSLNNFIQSNNLEILGNPLPKADEEVKGDFNNPGDFEFVYEIGLAPSFELDINKKQKFDYLKVDIDKAMLDKEVDNLARRYGKLVESEKVSDKDMVIGTFTSEDGAISNSSTISMEFIEDTKTKKQLAGTKVGDVLSLDPRKVSRDDKDLTAMLGIETAQIETLPKTLDFKITEIKTMIPAAIDQELFDKLFGPGTVKSEDELREKIKTDLTNMFQNDSDRLFSQSVTEKIIEKTKFDLPENFLKRWIKESSKEEISMEEIEADFENYKKSLKWQLIQNKIIKDNNMQVQAPEVIDYTKGLLTNQYAQYGMPAPEDSELENQAKNVLSNQEEANKIYENIYGFKIMTFFKENVKLNEKALPYDKFIEEAYAQK
ncbi:MAG: trigger factor [Putridiphycobacter sp.]|nr:trigger factor [Putridiphycobacter sp.]